MGRHSQDYDEENVDTQRQRHLSATQVSAPASAADDSTFTYDASRILQQPPHYSAAQSDSAGGQEILAGGDGAVAETAEQTAAALFAARQQLLRQVGCISYA